jgi:Holliday junction resolvase RusA-like endonuclease
MHMIESRLGEETLSLVIPGIPISGSQLKFNRQTGAAYRPKEHKQRVYSVYEYVNRELERQGLTGPVYSREKALVMGGCFYFPFRKGDYGTGRNQGRLKPSAPRYVIGTKDLDNLLKPLKDGLKGLVFVDDNQIVGYSSLWKMYSENPRTVIRIQEVVNVAP